MVAGVVAASCAGACERIPCAERRVGVASSRSSSVFALGDALTGNRVDFAASVVLAGSEIGSVGSRASLLADSGDETAFSCSVADLSGLSSALRVAVACSGVPGADGGRAGALSGVATSAGSLAGALSVVAGSGSSASILALNESALGGASLSVGVPLAVESGIASSLRTVLVVALGDARGAREFALRLSEAVSGCASFARGNTSGGLRGEHTFRIGIAIVSGGVADDATLFACLDA